MKPGKAGVCSVTYPRVKALGTESAVLVQVQPRSEGIRHTDVPGPENYCVAAT